MSDCGFCHGKPVGDAATWLDGKLRPPAPCPRCGETYYDPEWIRALLDIAEAAYKMEQRYSLVTPLALTNALARLEAL